MNNDKQTIPFRTTIAWPFIAGLFFIALDIYLYFKDSKTGLIGSVLILIYYIASAVFFLIKMSKVKKTLINYSMNTEKVITTMARNFNVPFAILDLDGTTLWENNIFIELFSKKLDKNHHIVDIDDMLTVDKFPEHLKESKDIHFHIDDCFYIATIHRVQLHGKTKSTSMRNKSEVFFIYIYDNTELVHLVKQTEDKKLDVALLYIDNYEESIEILDDVRRSLIAAVIDRKINKYMLQYDAITRRLEKDKYQIVFHHEYLPLMTANKFSLLDDIRSTNTNTDVAPTISIGIGTQGETLKKRQEHSRSAIDLALARGGDQVVIKNDNNIKYYGGKSIQQEKTTRVKARVKAHAIRESMQACERIVIMGHQFPDMDAIGSAIGLYRAAQILGKPTKIVVNQVTAPLKPMLDLFKDNKDYPEDLFVSSEKAKEFIGNGKGVLLIVTDCNRPSYTDAPDLLNLNTSIVVIDHHRRIEETFENTTLSYVEPYASSACEMVAEILQYIGEEIHLKSLEADAMYAGIMVDTNNFMNTPGVRTFEAVAYLRKSGADITRIRKMFRSDINEYKVRAEAIKNTELFLDSFAIAPCNADGCDSPNIVGAKIADALLDIKGTKASFVLTEYNGRIFISARSIDELNVQVVMEKFGGGGHMTSAGAQVLGKTMEETIKQVKDTLSKMKEEGDI